MGSRLPRGGTPAPLHLVFGALAARGLDVRERIGLVTAFRRICARDLWRRTRRPSPQYLADTPLHAMAAVWEPLCISALNTPPESASARIFGNVVRETFSGSSRNSDFLIPALDLSALFPDAAARYIHRHGGAVQYELHGERDRTPRVRRRRPRRRGLPPVRRRDHRRAVRINWQRRSGATRRSGAPRSRRSQPSPTSRSRPSISRMRSQWRFPFRSCGSTMRPASGSLIGARRSVRRRRRVHAASWRSSSAPTGRMTRWTTRRSRAQATRSCGGSPGNGRCRSGRASSPSVARRTPADRDSRGRVMAELPEPLSRRRLHGPGAAGDTRGGNANRRRGRPRAARRPRNIASGQSRTRTTGYLNDDHAQRQAKCRCIDVGSCLRW